MTPDDLVLTTDQKGEIHKPVRAIEHREYLADIGPREIEKILPIGSPGTGKTIAPWTLAYGLGLPFVEVRLSVITSRYFGETAKSVEKAFEVTKCLSPCTFFTDEFGSVAKTRWSGEYATFKHAVSTLPKSIDDISLIRGEVALIGVTNHSDQLDSTVWWRFGETVNLPKSNRGMCADIPRVIIDRVDIDELDPPVTVDATEGLTGSDLRLVLREAILEAPTEERMELT